MEILSVRLNTKDLVKKNVSQNIEIVTTQSSQIIRRKGERTL